MSWSRALPRARAAGALLACLGLAACGFAPLYGSGSKAVGAAELDTIQVSPLTERQGQLLHTYLVQDFNPDGRQGETLYHLDIRLTSNTRRLGVRRDATATRANLTLTARLILREIATDQVLFQGNSFTTVSYNILDAPYATVAAEQDAMNRAVRELADNIKLRVATFMAHHQRKA